MISDSDYTEFENFTKWLGVTQWLSGSSLRSLSSQKLWFCFLLSNVACYWYLQTWYLVLAFVVFYRWIFTSRYLWHLLWEQSICNFQYSLCLCLWLYWLLEFTWSVMSYLCHKAYPIAMYSILNYKMFRLF